MEGTFAACLKNYLETGENGRKTGLSEMKVFILDKANREAYVAELESYGYKIRAQV